MLTSYSRQIIGEMTTIIFTRLAEAAHEQLQQQQQQQQEARAPHNNGDAPAQTVAQQQRTAGQALDDAPPPSDKFGHGMVSAREVLIFLMDLMMQRQVGRAGSDAMASQ